ncbi:MAG: hypothetical protein ISS52_00180 [Dehalococcoidia bacterium]|nr:hypothetical protein [Dehalococcoidia bacterium]
MQQLGLGRTGILPLVSTLAVVICLASCGGEPATYEARLLTGDTEPLHISQVEYWAYQIDDLGEPGAVDKLANTHYDMLVLEPTRTDWSSDDRYFDAEAMVSQLRHSRAYIDIGVALGSLGESGVSLRATCP